MFYFLPVFLSGLAIYTLLLCCFSRAMVSFSMWKKIFLICVLFIFIFFPFLQLSIFQYLRSFFGNLSIASLGFFGVVAAQKLCSRSIVQKSEAKIFCVVVVVMAAFLYPMSLGLSYFDPYAWGFGHLYFEFFLGLCTLFWVWKGYFFLAAWWLISYVLYLLQAFESNNLWDYLIDPIVCLGAGFFLVVSYCKNKKGGERC